MGKKILVLSGGGSHGAYQVGVLKKLVEQGQSWDLVVGVSVGALNGTFIAMHTQLTLQERFHNLEEIWNGIKSTEDIIKPWWPILNSLPAFFKGSLKNTAPLWDVIQKSFNGQKLSRSGVDLRIGVVSLGTGQYKTVTKEEPSFFQWVLASCAMPIVMPPVQLNGDKWVDGCVRTYVPIRSIQDLLDQEDVEEIDVILTGSTHPDTFTVDNAQTSNLLKLTARAAQVAFNELYQADLARLKTLGVKVKIFQPSKPILLNSMEFPGDELKQLIQLGYDETDALLKRQREDEQG